jgi:hypothetical protein
LGYFDANYARPVSAFTWSNPSCFDKQIGASILLFLVTWADQLIRAEVHRAAFGAG